MMAMWNPHMKLQPRQTVGNQGQVVHWQALVAPPPIGVAPGRTRHITSCTWPTGWGRAHPASRTRGSQVRCRWARARAGGANGPTGRPSPVRLSAARRVSKHWQPQLVAASERSSQEERARHATVQLPSRRDAGVGADPLNLLPNRAPSPLRTRPCLPTRPTVISPPARDHLARRAAATAPSPTRPAREVNDDQPVEPRPGRRSRAV
jgi:hypothetical protein